MELHVAGFVTIRNPSAYGLIPNTNVIAAIDNIYIPSAFHQLHCLHALQLLYVTLQNSGRSGEAISPDDHKHMNHCLDYI